MAKIVEIASLSINIDQVLAESAKLKKEIESLKKVQKELDTSTKEGATAFVKNDVALKKMNKTLKDNQKIVSSLDTSNKELDKTISKNTKTLNTLKSSEKEENKIKKLTNTINKSAEGSYNKLSAQYALNKMQLDKMSAAERSGTAAGKKLEAETKNIYNEMIKLQRATGQSQLTVGQYERGIGKMTSAFAGMPGPMGRVVFGFKTLTAAAKAFIATPIGIVLAAFVAAGAAIKKVITTAKEFSEQMSVVKAITGATRKELRLLRRDAKELGRTTSKTATEVGQLQEEFAKLGFTTKEILAATKATIELSEASKSDLADAARVAANTVRGFGLTAQDTLRVVDVMALSFSSTALNLEKFSTSMANVAPVARVNNVSLERATALLGILVNAGLDASMAGTSLRNIFLQLSAKGLTFEKAMSEIRNSSDKAATSMSLFGKRGAVAGLLISSSTDKINDLTKAFNNADGAASKMAKTMRDDLKGDTVKFKSAWQGLFLSIDDGTNVFTKTARSFVQSMTKLVTWITNVRNNFAEFWNNIIKKSSIFRGLVIVISSMVNNLLKIFTMNIFKAKGVVEDGGNAIKSIFTGIGKAAKGLAKIIVSAFKIIKSAVALDFEGVKTNWENLTSTVVSGLDSVKTKAANVKKGISNIFGTNSIDKYLIKLKKVNETIEDTDNRNIVKEQERLIKLAEERRKKEEERRKKAEAAKNKEIELRVNNAREELELYIKNNKSKLSSDRFLSEESYKLEQKRLETIASKKREFAEIEFANGVSTQQEYNKTLREIDDENYSALQDLKNERKAAEMEQMAVDLDNELAIIEESNRNKYEIETARLEKSRKAELENAKKTGADLALINKKYALRQKNIDKELTNTRLSEYSKMFGNISQLLGENTKAGKAAGIAQATINTYQGVTEVWKAPAVLPEPANTISKIAASGVTLASGLSAVKKISSTPTKYSRGDILKGKSHAEGGIPFSINKQLGFEAEGGEAIINKKSTAAYKPLLSAINSAGGGKKFENGFIPESTAATSPLIDYDVLADKVALANQNLPNPVVSVEEINSVADNVRVVEDLSTL